MRQVSLVYFVTDFSNEKCYEKSYTRVIYFPKNFKVQPMVNELMSRRDKLTELLTRE